MPIYEFKCVTCNRTVEEICKSTDPSPVCHFCGSPTIKIPSTFGIAVRGQFTAKKELPSNRVELDDFISDFGHAPLYSNPESKERARWALKKVKFGEYDAKI